MSELIWQTARELTRLMRGGEVSAVEVMNAHYDQIERFNPELNAIVNPLPRDAALELAHAADARLAGGETLGPLHGLPMAVKDLEDAAGFPTTWGFKPWAGRVAAADGEVAARQRRAGALIIGKTNTPEFGLGSHTFNAVFGTTRNPWDPSRTPGGSSGGAAAALAAGLVALADGSDMGGSLRNPASFCNVVGLRPSMGRVPGARAFGWFARLSTPGPMARNVSDTALLLSVQAGPSAEEPLSLPDPGTAFAEPPAVDPRALRIAWSPDMGGLPVDPEVAGVCARAAATFTELGSRVEEACPDLNGAMDVFQVQRAASLAPAAQALERTLPDWREHAKDTAVWNFEKGLSLTWDEVLRAEVERTAIYRRVAAFLTEYDALLLPAAQVPPFPAEIDWVRDINGHAMGNYLEWMTVCCAISVTGLPAISVPGGFTAGGLPVGVQIVGRPRGDRVLLGIAQTFERATGHHTTRPPLVRGRPRTASSD